MYKSTSLITIGNVKIDQVVARNELKVMFKADREIASSYSDQTVERAILIALKGIRFGSVEIIIHDSKVVQIERKEKTRFDGTPSHSVR